MKIGAVYPQIELGGSPVALDRIGRAVEEMGLDHLVMYDHVVGAVHEGRDPPLNGPYTQNDPFHDPLVAFAYLAGVTRRIELISGVLILPQRQTVLVAKQATDVALLSGNRLRLGVGIGWNYVEYQALGQGFETRGARINEQIPFLRRLWTETEIDWQGRFDSINRGNLVPRPERPIPIFVGGVSEAAYQRAAIWGDGFLFAGGTVADILPKWDRVRALLTEKGRPVDGFEAHCLIMDERFAGLDAVAAADNIRRWQDAGGTAASIVTMGRGFRTADEHLDHFARVRQALGGVG